MKKVYVTSFQIFTLIVATLFVTIITVYEYIVEKVYSYTLLFATVLLYVLLGILIYAYKRKVPMYIVEE